MTDKEKLTKIRAELERVMEWEKEQAAHTYGNLCQLHECRADMCDKFLSFIDSMQKEHKECMYSKDNYTDEDRKSLCDGCTEECRYSKLNTMLDDALSKETKESWNKRLGEEPTTSVWHKVTEEPTMGKWILLQHSEGWYHVGRMSIGKFDKLWVSDGCSAFLLSAFSKWAYIDDLLKL